MPLKLKVDINSDLGESYGAFKVGNDEEIMPHITSANVACGFHAGDPVTISKTVALAKSYNVAVGAHPGYPDLMGFGRREMHLSLEEIESYAIYQVGALQAFANASALNLQHVKPHGALYNMALKDEKLSEAIVNAVKAISENLIIFTPPKSALAKVAAKHGLKVAFEFFADRAYNPDGSLVSRTKKDAIIKEPEKVLERAIQAVEEKSVLAVTGEMVNLGEVHTICLHGDTPNAREIASFLKKGLMKKGIDVKSVGNFL